MEEKQNQEGSVVLALVSFFSSIVSIFTMYYIFAAIALICSLFSFKKPNSRGIAITSMTIVIVTLVIKIINVLLLSGNLPQWLTNGLF